MNRKISVVIPVYNTEVYQLIEALDSVSDQTLSKDLFELIIVDDGSDYAELKKTLFYLSQSPVYKGVRIKILTHKTRRWIVEARATGIEYSRCEYILLLDSDDKIEKSFLKKSLLLLETDPAIGWVYTKKVKFGNIQKSFDAAEFSVWSFVLKNKCSYASLFRKRAWAKVPQREKKVTANIRFFEDWDFYIRLIASGWHGVPLSDTEFYYRISDKSTITRTPREYMASVYITWHVNFIRIPSILLSYLKHRSRKRKGWFELSKFNPLYSVNRWLSQFASKSLEVPAYPLGMSWAQIFNAAFRPQQFVSDFLDKQKSITLAEYLSEFRRKPDLNLAEQQYNISTEQHTIIFAHTWWDYGGAENVLLNWIRQAREIPSTKLLDITQKITDANGTVRQQYSEFVDEQYDLSLIGQSPRDKLMFCWNLICYEQPKIIFVSANSYFYTLTPLIKTCFPQTVVVDILHNEYDDAYFDWFGVSQEYFEFVNHHVVISDHWKSVLQTKFAEDESKIHVCHNGVDLDVFDPSKFDSNTEKDLLNLPTDAAIVGFIGRLHEQKNPMVFVELARIHKDNASFHFVLAGSGDMEDEVLTNISGLTNITFLGYTNEVAKLLSVIDVLICPSKFEGFPLIGLEAAAMSVAVISANITGFREQINSGNFGWLYDPTGDAIADAQTITAIIEKNKYRLKSTGENGAAYVESAHGLQKTNQRYSELLNLWLDKNTEISHHTGIAPKKRKLFLHIGQAKTGTTFLQRFLSDNADFLAEQSILYPCSHMGIAQHSLITVLAKPNKLKIHLLENIDKHLNSYDQIRNEILNSDANTVVISTETLSVQESFNPKAFRQFLRDIKINRRNVYVICFIRKPDEFFESIFSQRHKSLRFGRKIMDEKEFLDVGIKRLIKRFKSILFWKKVLPKENIKLIAFEKQAFPDGLHHRFLNEIGASTDVDYRVPPRENPRFSRDCIAYFRENMRRIKQLEHNELNYLFHLLEQFSAKQHNADGKAHYFSPQDRQKFLLAASENYKYALTGLGYDLESFFQDFSVDSNEPWKPYDGLNDKKRRKINQYLKKAGLELPNAVEKKVVAISKARPNKLILHIGAGKCGSTFLQNYLRVNLGEFSRQGVFYIDKNIFTLNDARILGNKVTNDCSMAAQHKLKQMLETANAKKFIYSQEPLLKLTPLKKGKQDFDISKFIAMFSQLDFEPENIKIIVFLRRADYLLESHINQNLKKGHYSIEDFSPKEIAEKLLQSGWFYDNIFCWKKACGCDLTVVPIQKNQAAEKLADDFLGFCDIEERSDLVLPIRINNSLNRNALAYLLSKFTSTQLHHETAGDMIQKLARYSLDHPTEDKYKYFTSPTERIDLLQRVWPCEQRIARELMAKSDNKLFYDDWPDPDEPWAVYPGLNEQAIEQIEHYLYTEKMPHDQASVATVN